MSSTFRFAEVDSDALVAELTEKYEEISGISISAASPEMLFIRWVASVLVQERALLNYAADQNIPSRASGENLDALGELFFQTERTAAQPARCTMRFTISEEQADAITVPAGTRVTDEERVLVWETEADAVIPAGSMSVDTAAVCQTAGSAGNGWAAGSLSTIVDVFDYYASCTNTTASEGGTNELTDEEYLELMRSSLNGYSTAGAIGGYEYHAKKVSGEIADIVVTSPSACRVTIYALMEGGVAAGAQIKAAILAECSADRVRPLTDFVSVSDPEAVEYDIDLTYWLPSGTDAAAVSAAIADAVTEYINWQGAKLGRNINPSKLMSLVMQAGAARCEITAPTFTELSGGTGGATPQYAHVGTTEITNGGVEDG